MNLTGLGSPIRYIRSSEHGLLDLELIGRGEAWPATSPDEEVPDPVRGMPGPHAPKILLETSFYAFLALAATFLRMCS